MVVLSSIDSWGVWLVAVVSRYSGEDRVGADTMKIALGVVLGVALVVGLAIAAYILLTGLLVMK